jgi:acetyl esterase/lipase
VGGLVACGGSEVTAPPPQPAALAIAPRDTALTAGEQLHLTAQVRDAAGHDLPGVSVTWISSNAAVVAIDTAGTAVSHTAGRAVVTARTATLADSVAIEVRAGRPMRLTVAPESVTVLVGATAQLSAAVTDAEGNPVPGSPVSWTTSDGSVATVDARGLVSATNPGNATITATSGTASGTAVLTVSFGQGARRGEAACAPNLMDVFIPADSFPRPLRAVVYIHGGGWVSGDRNGSPWFTELRDSLLDRGLLVVSADYRLAPGARWPAQIQDLKCAIRSLRARAARYGLDPDRIGAFGESVGGHLAALLDVTDPSAGFDGSSFGGFSSQVLAAAGLAGVYDLTRPGELNFNGPAQTFSQWPDSTSSQLIDASPIHWASATDGPMLLIHGGQDSKVAPAQAQRFATALQAAGVAVTLQIVANADHGLDPAGPGPTNPTRTALTQQLVDFLDRMVR